MDFTSINEISKSDLGSFYCQNIVAGKNNPVSFQAVLDVNMGGLEDRLKAQYPNLKKYKTILYSRQKPGNSTEFPVDDDVLFIYNNLFY